MKEKDTPMRRVRWWSGLIPNVYEQMDRLKRSEERRVGKECL